MVKFNFSFNGIMCLLAITAFIWLIVFPLFQLGMFTDGLLYASIARNFYLGKGSWWNIYSHETTGIFFHEQPPLVFWMQSFFFTMLGDTIYSERIYSLVLILLSAIIIIKFWKELNHEIKTAWLPVILWLSIYSVRFSVINNLIENSLQFFDLVSVLFLFKAMRNKKVFLNLFLGFLFLFLASLSKGIQGLFPIVVPVCYWLNFRNSSTRKSIATTFFLLSATIGIYFLMIQSTEIMESYKAYFASRFPGFPNTPHATTEYRLYIFIELLIQLLPPAILCFAVIFFIKRKLRINIPFTAEQKRISIFFLLIGLSASLPLIVSFEQRFFYLTTSMPYFVLALSVLIEKYFYELSIHFQNKIQFLKKITFILLMGIALGFATVFLFAGKITRDKEMLNDILKIGNRTKGESLIDISSEGWNNWTAHMYFRRYFNIEFVAGTNGHSFYLHPKKEGEFNSPYYNKVNWGTEYYDVFEKK
ncbi:MAG: hypothetical protein D4R43_00310 [Sphingobacteriales bacterium]|nr:MAG: hypothetical protein D4R43_00310 [Sphingobacteriales bacterium]